MNMEALVHKSLQEELGNKTNLNNKPKRIRKIRPGVCTYCNKWFADGRHLYAHVRIHTGEKPFVCDVCHKAFNQNSNLRRHLVVHSERKPLVCNICGRQLFDKLHFNEHVRAHSGERPYVCTICNKKYSFKGSLNRHLINHAKQNNFICTICNEGFTHHYLLKYHMHTHNKETNSYPCTLCKKVFSQSYRFQNHLITKHNIKIAFQCKICNARFSSKRMLQRHYHTHKKDDDSNIPETELQVETEQVHESENDSTNNTEISRAAQNKDVIESEEEQDITITKNRYLCGICYEEFTSTSSVKEHLYTHTKEIIFVCCNCKKSFPSRVLLEHHACSSVTNIKLLECYICEEQFSSKSDLKEHLSKHTEVDDYF